MVGETDIAAETAAGHTIGLIDPYELPAEVITNGHQRHTNFLRMANRYVLKFDAPLRQQTTLRTGNEGWYPPATATWPTPIDIFLCEIWINVDYMAFRNHNWTMDGNKNNFLLPLPNNIKYVQNQYNAYHTNPIFISGAQLNACFAHFYSFGNLNEDVMPFYKRKLDPRFARWGRKKVRRYNPKVLHDGMVYEMVNGIATNNRVNVEVLENKTITMSMSFREKHCTFDAQDDNKDNGLLPAQVRAPIFSRISARASKRGWRRYVIFGMTHAIDEQLILADYHNDGLNVKLIEERRWRSNNPQITDVD